MKMAVPSSEFIKLKEVKAAFDEPRPLFLIGHCRSATKGKISVDNAHPFNFKNVIGVHNGTIHGKFPHSDEFETDSEALYKNIDELGIKAGLEAAIGFSGAFALAFYDKKTKELCFTRNDKRPLHFTFIANGTTMLVSSTREDLEFVIDKSSYIASGWENMKESPIFTLTPETILIVPVGQSVKKATIHRLELKPESRFSSASYGSEWEDYEGYGAYGSDYGMSYRRHRDNFFNSSDWVRGPDGVFRSKADHQKYMERHTKDSKRLQDAFDGVEVDDESDPAGDLSSLPWLDQHEAKKSVDTDKHRSKSLIVLGKPEKDVIRVPQSLKEREVKLKQGCFCCGTVVDIAEVDSVHWWDRDSYACDDCYKNEAWVRCSLTDDWSEFEAEHGKKN